ncbi:MAG TPA: DUF2934 domain-containing protein [Nitrospiraceae bacterium]|nr:DUF2934 domain-containing protein [Nitrospiraceae bacterium]
MEKQTQEHSGKKQQFDIKGSRPTTPAVHNPPLLRAEAKKQKGKEAQASMDTQSKAMSDEEQARVAELAYGLYEEHGRKDGHDLEDWFKAERHIMTQGRLSSRSL